MRFEGVCYRFLEPVYASDPVSGEGARIHGGRFNPKGVPTLYMACSVPTAGIEAAHGFEGRVAPLMLCSYDVDVEDIVDLTSAAQRQAAAIKPGWLNCAWRFDLSNGVEPASWRIAKKLIVDGVAGILVPSYARGAGRSDRNLVLWKWSAAAPHKVVVYDPFGSLPLNKSSWTKPLP